MYWLIHNLSYDWLIHAIDGEVVMHYFIVGCDHNNILTMHCIEPTQVATNKASNF